MEHAFCCGKGAQGEWWLGHEHRIRQNLIYRVRRPFQERFEATLHELCSNQQLPHCLEESY